MSPLFITKATSSRRATFSSGSPATATRSANFPGSIEPRSSDARRSSALTIVALRIACIGVIPYRTMYANCRATSQCGYTPLSVPYAIFTPAFTDFSNPSRWASVVSRFLRSEFGDQPARVPSSSIQSPQ